MAIRTRMIVLALSALLLGSGTVLIASAAVPGVPDIPGVGRGPGFPGVPTIPGRPDIPGPGSIPDARGPTGSPGSRNPDQDVRSFEERERLNDEERDRNDAVLRELVVGIDSSDSCMLQVTARQARASGDCPGGKSCIVQERRKGSVQDWKDSIGNPQPYEAQQEYRPFCR